MITSKIVDCWSNAEYEEEIMTYAEFFYEIKSKFMGADVSDIKEHLAYQFCIEDEEAVVLFMWK